MPAPRLSLALACLAIALTSRSPAFPQAAAPISTPKAPAPPEAPMIEKAAKAANAVVAISSQSIPAWTKLTTEPYPGKQDDIFFINPDLGWYVNGAGKIFKTTDGGKTWAQKLHAKGTFFRCIAFVNESLGFAGNIGPDYFPNVTDTNPLYRTDDGGETWAVVDAVKPSAASPGKPALVGLCAIEVLREPFINSGNLDTFTRILAVGRVGGPAAFLFSDDLGKSWQTVDIAPHAAMAFDVHFFDRNHGVIAAASSTDVAESHARILTTSDAGKTWTIAYESKRPFELTWKISFPSRSVGYVTIQSYNPDPAVTERFVAKTTDAGKTWSEVPLSNDPKVRAFGVAFADDLTGWVGAMPAGFQTTDGGATWTPATFGNAVNKIRLLKAPTPSSPNRVVGFAIGVNASRLDWAPPAPPAPTPTPAPTPATHRHTD